MKHFARHRSIRPIEGDVHVGTMGADIALVPGSTTPEGAAAVEREARRVLTRVRRGIERRRWRRCRR